MATEHYMRGEEHMILYFPVMPNVVAAPQHYVVAYFSKRLQSIVLQDEAVLADLIVAYSSLRTYVADVGVTFVFPLQINALSQLVHLSGGHRRKKMKITWGIMHL